MKLKNIKNNMPLIGLIIVIIIFAALTGGKSLKPNNLKLVLEQSMTIIISAAGVIFVMSMGSLDFSQGSLLAFACYCAAWLSGTNIILACASAIIVGMLVGCLNGFLNAVLKIQSFIATIGMMLIFRGLVVFLTTKYMPKIPYSIYGLNNFNVKLMSMIIIIIVGGFVFHYTSFGRKVRAIGAGEMAAKFSGTNVKLIKIAAFAIAGAMAGVAAFFSLLRAGSITATTGNLLETNVMIALVLGGVPVSGGFKVKYIAVLIGGFLLAFLENGLVQIGVSITMQQLIKGIVFLGTIILATDRKADMISK